MLASDPATRATRRRRRAECPEDRGPLRGNERSLPDAALGRPPRADAIKDEGSLVNQSGRVQSYVNISVHQGIGRMEQRIKHMKYLLNGVAAAAALVIAAPVWAQAPGGNSVGAPGPNPGGPGLTPYSGGAQTAPPANSAMPPPHHHARAMHHFHHHMARKAALSGDTTGQLNREELARIQSGNLGNPPAPPAPGPGAGPGPGQEQMPTDMSGPRTSGASGAGTR